MGTFPAYLHAERPMANVRNVTLDAGVALWANGDLRTTGRVRHPGGIPVNQAAAGSHARRVVAVDDEPAVTLLIQRVLESAGYEVRTAASGEEALEVMERFQPDLLIVDKNLPRMNGFEVVTAARARLPNLPVMVITAAPEMLQGQSERIDAYLAKPFRSLDALRAAVAEAFERNRAARERLELQRKLDEVVAQLRRH